MGKTNSLSRAVLSGLMLCLAWPPVNMSFLLPFAFVPFFINLYRSTSLKKGLLLSFITFFIWSVGTMYWFAMIDVPGGNLLVVLSAYLLIPLFMLLPVIPVSLLMKRRSLSALWLFIPFWASYEFLHMKWELAFTWLHLGFGLSPFPFFMQFYEYTGYLGGTVIILLFNILITISLLKKKKRKTFSLLFIGCLALFILVNGALLSSKENEDRARVTAIQPNRNPYQKLTKKSLYNRTMTFINQMRKVPAETKLIVGPEGYLKARPEAPIILNNLQSNPAIKALQKEVDSLDTDLLIGGIGVWEYRNAKPHEVAKATAPTGNFYTLHNVAIFLSPGKGPSFSVKNHLVPFMERVPFLSAFPGLSDMKFGLNQMKLNYSRTDSLVAFKGKYAHVLPAICLDEHFPAWLATKVNQSNCISIISNDSWAGKSAGYQQNAAYSSILAVSFRKPVIRSANTGKSVVLNRKGEVISKAEWNEKKVISQEVHFSSKSTVYSRFPQLPGYISLLLSALLSILFLILPPKGNL